MYWNDGAHARPRFHARYAGQAASIDFAGERLADRDELLANWERAPREEPPQPIEPLP